MTDLIFIKTGADWVDTTSYVNTFKFEDKGKASLNKLSVEFRNDIVSSDENPEFDKEIRWEFDGTVIFGGKINKPKSNFPIIGIEAYSYGEQLLDLYENNVYENQSPEAIATTIIETDTDLTVASSAVSNVTIDKIPFRDKRKAACVSILISDLLNWTFRTDYLKNAYIEEPGSTNSNLTLTYGDNLLVKPKWDYNTDNVVNKVIVEGDIQNFNTTGTYLGTGTYQTISLSFIPSGSVKVESPVGTEINPIVEGSSTGSYRLDVENKNITGSFASGNVQVSYSYSIPIRINLPAESGYSKREGKIKSKTIKSYSEARKIGKQYLSVYGLPQKSTTATLFGFHKDLISGRLIRVIDSTELTASATGIDEDFVMNKITYNYPNKICNITVGPLQVELFDWQKRVDEAIRELQ